MSRFFADDSDDDDDDSQSGSEVDSEEEEEVDQTTKASGAKFMYDSSDSEEEKRVVRTEKDKRYDEMQSTVKVLKNHMKINDWVAISVDFDNLNKQLDKAKNITRKEGIPRFYMKACLSIEELCNKMSDKSQGKKMNASNGRALNTMRSKLRKWTKQYPAEIAAYNKNPLLSDEEEEGPQKRKRKPKKEDTEDDEEEEKKSAPKKKGPVKKSPDSDQDDDDDADDEGDDSEEWDETDTEDEDDEPVDFSSKDMFSRSFWLKKNTTTATVKAKKTRVKQQRKVSEKEEKEEKLEGKKDHDEKIYTPEYIIKKLKDLAEARGKRSTNRKEVVEELKVLAEKATAVALKLKIKATLMTAYYDLTLNTMKYQPFPVWKDAVGTLLEIIQILNENPDVHLSEEAENVKDAFEDEEGESFLSLETLMENEEEEEKRKEAERKKKEEELQANGGPGVQYVNGNIYSFVQRCCAEFKSSLQHIDPHSPEYVDRLKDEPALLNLVTVSQEYYERIGNMAFQRYTCLLRLELMYYHYSPAQDYQKIKSQKEEEKQETTYLPTGPNNPLKNDDSVVAKLAIFLYKHGESREKTRALLCHIFWLALHNRFNEARDLLLMSHVQDTIGDADIRTRILFNRAMAQLGLCAFRIGEYRQALNSLAELYLSNRIKELLAQGISTSRFSERDLKKEQLEKRRQYPYHMHMNLDVLESVHLLAAMFVEVPNTAQNGQDNKRKVISKVFRRLLDHHQGKAFNGPPENTRDCVMAATTKLQRGNWQECLENVQRLKMWSLVPMPELVLDNVKEKIKDVGLRTYLLSYASHYGSISQESLCDMFEMGEKEVYRICSKMMVNEELQGAWDQPSRCIIMHASVASKLQRAALQYADKAALFLEQNERLLEQRFGYSSTHQHRNWDNNNNQGGSSNNNQGGGNHYGNYNRRSSYHNARGSYDLGRVS